MQENKENKKDVKEINIDVKDTYASLDDFFDEGGDSYSVETDWEELLEIVEEMGF